MQRCLDLALMGLGITRPNPMVGCVIVHDGWIIGEGSTSSYGQSHAEVNAINSVIDRYGSEVAKRLISQSVIYVSLEPCAHFGKTPPCANLLVSYKPKKVVIACLDPFEKVKGKGVQILENAGVACEVGMLEKEAKWVNRRFFTKVEKLRPYVILKWAETEDKYFAPTDGKQKWITHKAAKQLVHKWRTEEDAILVGKNTTLIDNPSLTAREWKGENPLRVLIDKNLDVPSTAAIMDKSAPTLVFNAVKFDHRNNVRYVEVENFDLYLPQNILYQLYLMDIQSVIIEGGRKTLDSFIEAGLWDEARILSSTDRWGEGILAPQVTGTLVKECKVGLDKLKIIKNELITFV